MRKAILVLFVLGFVSMNGYAQKVYKKDGKFYLECTVASGMPAGSVTRTPKCVGGTASNSDYRDTDPYNRNPYAWENDQVFEKLEIDASDFNNAEMDWVTAYNGCKAKNTSSVTGWRLPTQRELMLMYIFRVQLGNNFNSSYSYWSSSESIYMSSSSWSVDFDDGETDGWYNKTEPYFRARCVREAL